MQVSHNFLPDSAVFDDDNLVSCVGLVPQIAGGHHGGQRPLGALAALQQPLREVGTTPQLWDLRIQSACLGIKSAMPIAAALIGALDAALTVIRTTPRRLQLPSACG